MSAVAGQRVGSHSHGHAPLPELDPDVLRDELSDPLRVLEEQMSQVPPLLAYPYGRHDERVWAAAAAGYRAPFATEPGGNGTGTDAYCLTRIGLKDWDGYSALLWKAITGELLPWPWERWRRYRVAAKATGRGASRRRPADLS